MRHIHPTVLESIVEHAFDAVVVTDASLEAPGPKIVYVNRAFCELTGYSTDEALGRSPRFLQGPLTDRETLKSLRDHLRAGKTFEATATNYHRDGTPYLIHWKTWPVFDGAGAVCAYVAVQHAEPPDTEDHTLTQALIEAMDCGVLGTNAEGTVTFVNNQVLTMLGLGSRTELLGRPATSFFDLKAQAADSLRAAILNDTPACFQAIRLVGNKTHGPRVDVTVNPVPGLDDNQVGHILVMSDATRRLETEAQLNRETRRLENILRGTDAGTWEWDLETNMLDVNDRWLTLIGHDENEPRHLTIDRWRELVHPDDVSLANERLAAHAAGQTDYYEVEFRMRHRDGHWVWILSRGKVMEWDESGRPKQFAGTHLDITALKRAQASELEEKSKFEALFDGLNDAVFVHPVEPFGYANFLEVNPVACERYGFTRDELLRRSPADLRDPDATQNLGSSSQLEVLMRTGHLLYETRHQAKGGRRFPVEISTKLFDYNGTQALMSLVRDISARKHNEAKILQATAMFDRSNEGIVVTDRDRRIISVNPAFERLTGYSRDEAIGRNPRFLQSGRHDEAFYRDLWHELECNGSWQGEIWNRRKGGELILEWQTITAVEDETGEVTNYISIFSDITRAKKSEEEVHYLSWHDPLTGLANRRQLENDLREVLDASGHAAVFYIDIDRFKQVNDSFGHAAGDDMLRQLARRMEDAVPEGGKLARFSGDEFVMLSQVDSVEKADDQARSLLERIDQPISLEGVDVALTATVGIAIGPEDGGDAPTLLRHAHSALHESKRSGRNTHTVYSPGTPNYSREKMLLESSLRLALEREDFVVCYQPQVDMRTGAIIGSEALVRWRPPNEPEISPGEFIPVAEDSGLIVALGEWVLRRACEESMSHARPEGKPRRVAVNLSGRQLIEKDIVGTVDKVLKETGMPPDSLELEVTETFLVEHRGAVDTLLGLKKLGVRLSIDDFGTGHSSLARLKELPVDKLKIDQAFVRGITGDNSDAAIARAIIALGNSLGMDVLAEGVENGDQGQFLIREGCFHGQGFLFGRAVNAEDILPLDQIEGGSVLSNGVRAGCAPQASSPFTPHC